MKISVIIPTCQRNDLLAQCLDQLAPEKQTGMHLSGPNDPEPAQAPAGKYEVIVSDDSLRPTAESMIRDRYPWAKWVSGPRRGPAANRNHGARHATGEWLMFLDDDCLPDSGLLAACAVEAASPATRVIEGRIYAERPQQSLAEIAPLNESGGCLWSCNFAIRRDLFDSMGGFDERFPYAAMEDVDFRLRLKQAGEKIHFVPGVSVCHPWRRWDSRNEFKKYEESLSIYLSIHPGEKGDFTTMAHLQAILRNFLKVTLPGVWRYRGAGFMEAMRHHFFHLRFAVCGCRILPSEKEETL